MGPKMEELKYWLITHATEIRETKKIHKENQRLKNDNSLMWPLYKMSQEYRHHHIAYSELRGRTREQIENPRLENRPNEDKIRKIKEEYSDGQKTLCVGS